MKSVKKSFCLLLCILLSFAVTACKGDETVKYEIPKKLSDEKTSTVAENGRFSLKWDKEANCVLLCEKSDGYVWSTVPYSAYLEGSDLLALNSDICIDYYDLSDCSMQTDKSHSSVTEGKVLSEKIKNGIRITYYFPVAEATVPVEYTLEKDGLRATVRSDSITETGKTKLITVSVAPFLCSVPNTDDKSSYLVIPTGSGALMYVDNEVQKSARSYTGDVYGTDASRFLLDDTENEVAVTFPVFGSRNSDGHGLFAIIDKGVEAARINASAGSMRYGYSNAYASFYLRGYDEVEQIIGSWRSDSLALSETLTPHAEYSVCYYPLGEEKSDYSGMADFYRDYLYNNKKLSKTKVKTADYQLEILGGALSKEFFLGIPYYSVKPLTTLKQAEKIINQAISDTGSNPAVVLSGYGTTGIDYGKTGGGFTVSNALGSKKEHKSVEKLCADKGINIFTDFELIYFTKSGAGFGKQFDTAKTANKQAVAKYPLKINLRSDDESSTKVRMLKRAELYTATERLIKTAKDKISGISLGSLGNTSYSDYSEEKTYMKGNTEQQTEEIIKKVQNSGHKVFLKGAFAYSAAFADSISYVPTDNGGYAVFDEYIPFYQMVFRGTKPLYTAPINYCSDKTAALLKAVETGTVPSYTISYSYKSGIDGGENEYLYATEWKSNVPLIKSNTELTKDYFSAIGDSQILSHSILQNGVKVTKYSNGITAYVNYSDCDQPLPNGKTVKAKDFYYEK